MKVTKITGSDTNEVPIKIEVPSLLGEKSSNTHPSEQVKHIIENTPNNLAILRNRLEKLTEKSDVILMSDISSQEREMIRLFLKEIHKNKEAEKSLYFSKYHASLGSHILQGAQIFDRPKFSAHRLNKIIQLLRFFN